MTEVEKADTGHLQVSRWGESQPAQVLLVARSVRGWLYFLARLMGDVSVVKRGNASAGESGRRVAGKVTGKGRSGGCSASFVRSCGLLFGWRVTVQHIAEDCPG